MLELSLFSRNPQFLTINDCFEEYICKSYELYPVRYKDSIVYSLDVPGIKKTDINITVKNGQCFINTKRRIGEKIKRIIDKSFQLPNTINVKTIKAKLKDGVLQISMKEDKEKTTIIEVE